MTATPRQQTITTYMYTTGIGGNADEMYTDSEEPMESCIQRHHFEQGIKATSTYDWSNREYKNVVNNSDIVETHGYV